MLKKNYTFHLIAALCLSVLGSAPITLLFENAASYSFLSFLIAAAAGLGLYLLLWQVLKGFPKEINKALFYPFIILGVLLSALSALLTLKDFWTFAGEVLLPKAPQYISLILILGVLIYLGFAKREAALKFVLVLLLPVTIIVITLFCLSVPSMKLMNISVYSLPPLKDLAEKALTYFLKIFSTAIPAVILAKSLESDPKKGSVITGVLTGFALSGGILLQTLLVLGNGVGSFKYPYLSAVGTLTFGNLFTRLDGFVYFLFFSCTVVKITVCINAAKYLLSLLKTKNSP